jgi:hypothetical protein
LRRQGTTDIVISLIKKTLETTPTPWGTPPLRGIIVISTIIKEAL